MMTPQQAKALAHLTALLRPDWNEHGIYAALGKCKDREPFAVALATIRAARDDGARTPGVIPSDGPHWRELEGVKATPDEAGRPPKKHEECKTHPGRWADNCGGCASDRLTGETTTPPELRRPDRSNQVARLRGELASLRSRLCPHSIDLNRGRCADCERPKPEPEEAAA